MFVVTVVSLNIYLDMYYNLGAFKKSKISKALVVHTYNPSYSGSRNQED
jgi:hypothetical protein